MAGKLSAKKGSQLGGGLFVVCCMGGVFVGMLTGQMAVAALGGVVVGLLILVLVRTLATDDK